jgi:hypothetical protein
LPIRFIAETVAFAGRKNPKLSLKPTLIAGEDKYAAGILQITVSYSVLRRRRDEDFLTTI